MSWRRAGYVSALLAAAAGLMLFLDRARPPRLTPFYDALFDAGHTPLFGAFALICLGLSRLLLDRPGRLRIAHYLIALGASLLASFLAEWAQVNGPRDADFVDFVRGAAGAASFLLLAATWDAPLVRAHALDRGRRLAALRGAAAVLLLASSAVAMSTTWSYLRRNLAFPRICEFQNPWETRFLRTQYATMEIGPLPERLGGDPGDRAARITFYRKRVPGLAIHELYPDWSGYDRLAFTVYSELEGAVELRMRVDDVRHRFLHSGRYEFGFTVRPGDNELSIPLAELRGDPEDELDLTRMCQLFLFARRPEESFSVYVDHFRLERD